MNNIPANVTDPWWWRLWPPFVWLVPHAKMVNHCKTRGTHRPVLIDGGRSKLCMVCGCW